MQEECFSYVQKAVVVNNTQLGLCAGIVTIYARYKFVEKLSEDTGMVKPCVNKTALVFGLISCVAMCIVATFQVRLDL